MGDYKYEPLNLSVPAIRLLRLLGGEDSEMICCELFQAEIHPRGSAISYEALSYTWGVLDFTESISVNGHRLRITYNLYRTIRQLRHRDTDRILWIDAICIDQSNKRERGHQVAQMGNIYREADCVIFRLGLGSYETNVFMESLQLLQHESVKHTYKSWLLQDDRWKDLWVSIQPALKKIHPDLEKSQILGFNEILSQSWFRRVWILQEVAFASAGVISCGKMSVAARFLSLAPLLLKVTPDTHHQSILDIMPSPWRADSWWNQSQNQSLFTLLTRFGRSEATEPRDLIYALRSMSSDVRNTNILAPDYEKPEEYIIRDVVQFIFHCDVEQLNWTLPKSIRDLLINFRNISINVFCGLKMESLSYYMKMQLKDPKFVVNQDMVKAVALQNTTSDVATVFQQFSGVEPEPKRKTADDDEGLDVAARNVVGATEMFIALASYQGDDILTITDRILMTAAENPKYADRPNDLLNYSITAIATAAARNERRKHKLFWALLRRQCYYESVVRQFLNQLLTEKEWRKWEQYAVSRVKRLMRGKDRRIWGIISTSTGIEIIPPGAWLPKPPPIPEESLFMRGRAEQYTLAITSRQGKIGTFQDANSVQLPLHRGYTIQYYET